MSLRGFTDFPLRPSGEPDPPASGRPPGSVEIYVTQLFYYGNGLNKDASQFVIWGHPRPHTLVKGLQQGALGLTHKDSLSLDFLYLPRFPYDFATPVPPQHCCVLSGVFSRAFFFLCPFSFVCFSRVRSFPSRRRSGSVSWLLFVVASFVVPFLLWFGGVVRFRLPFSCFCLCVGCFVVGRFRGVCASWLVFCRRVCLVCLCACRALSRLVLGGGGRPPFFVRSLFILRLLISFIS